MSRPRIEKPTRIEINRAGTSYLRQEWFGEWEENTPPARQDFVVGTMLKFADEFAADGYSVTLLDAHHLLALGGTITRVDFILMADGWHVKKYPYGWTARTRPVREEVKPIDFNVDEALYWLRQNGWKTRQWEGTPNANAGARAFLGKPMPVRDRQSIVQMRDRIGIHHYDYAFDF